MNTFFKTTSQVVSLGTVFLSLMGLFFQYMLLKSFGVNYFNYAEAGDFLVAAGIALDTIYEISIGEKLLVFLGAVFYLSALALLIKWETRKRHAKIAALTKKKEQLNNRLQGTVGLDKDIRRIDAEIEKIKKSNASSARVFKFAMPLFVIIACSLYLAGISDASDNLMARIARAEVRPIQLQSVSPRYTVSPPSPGNKLYLVTTTSSHIIVLERHDPNGPKPKVHQNRTHIIPRSFVMVTYR